MDTDAGKEKGARDLSGTGKVTMAWLGFEDDKVSLKIWPGDTMAQSRALYSDPSAINAVLALRSDGWRVEPNFHWGFMSSGLAWLKTPLAVEKYCHYWIKEIGSTHELSRSEWNNYWVNLERAQIVEAEEKEIFDKHFTDTHRQKAQPRPGLLCEYTWSLSEAQRLDAQDKFIKKVRERLNQILTTLGAPTL